MRLFADTADIAHLEELKQLGIISGVTTNPVILSREGGSCRETLRNICRLFPDEPVFAQAVGRTTEELVSEGEKISSIAENLIVKIPVSKAAYTAIKTLKNKGITVCATTVLSESQALFAALAGADYVAPYVRDIDDIGYDGFAVLGSILEMMSAEDMNTKVLAAAINSPQDMVRAADMGTDILTVSYEAIMAACSRMQPVSEFYLSLFENAWVQNACSFD